MKFTFKNLRGDVLDLVNSEDFKLTNVDGQTRANSNISSTVTGGIDGDSVNNIQAQPRSIVLDLKMLDNVEKTKRKILNIVKLKQDGVLCWEQNDRTVEITGKVESIEMPRWTDGVIMQITIHCGQPFWEDIEEIVTEVNESIPLHYFTVYPNDQLIFTSSGIPFGEYDLIRRRTINNTGDVSVGLEIDILAFGTVTNPIIYNHLGEFFGIGHGTGNKKVVMSAGDRIKIYTGINEKAVTLNGVNMLAKIKPQSVWLQLQAGENEFAINSDDVSTENMQFNLTYKQRYV